MTSNTAPHILVIDDDPSIRDLIQEYLGDHDMRVSVGASGSDLFSLIDSEAIDQVAIPDGKTLKLGMTDERVPLLCRGQVIPSSSELVYEIFIEEIVCGPVPRLYADLRAYEQKQVEIDEGRLAAE